MSGLVIELQRDALSPSVHVSDLLRKGLVISMKLNLKELEDWIALELGGYGGQDNEKIPNYRIVKGEVHAFNPFRGWIPVVFANVQAAKFFSTFLMPQPITEIEEMIKDTKHEMVIISFPQEAKMHLLKSLDTSMQVGLHINSTTIRGITHAVRNIIIEWSVKLEQKGILGEGMTFSPQEKSTAATSTFHIQNMYHSQIQQGTNSSTQIMVTQDLDLTQVKQLIESLKPVIDQLGLEQTEKDQLLADIQTVEPQLAAPKPSRVILRESLASMRTILEGAVGNIIASGLLAKLNLFLSALPS